MLAREMFRQHVVAGVVDKQGFVALGAVERDGQFADAFGVVSEAVPFPVLEIIIFFIIIYITNRLGIAISLLL